MYTFKQYLEEKMAADVAWIQKAPEMVFSGRVKVPITSALNKAFGELRMDVFHACNYKNLERLLKMQGSKKGISVALDFKPSIYTMEKPIAGDLKGQGGRSVLDCIVKLDASVLAGSGSDINSQPDFSGRRWLPLEHLFDYTLIDKDTGNLAAELQGKLEKYRQVLGWEIAQKWAKKDPEKAAAPSEIQIIAFARMAVNERKSMDMAQDIFDWMYRLNDQKTPEMNKDIGKAVKDYIDYFNHLIIRYNKKIEKAFRNGFETTYTGYNEFVANDFQVKSVVWLNKEGYDLAAKKGLTKKVKSVKGFKEDDGGRRGSRVHQPTVEKFLKR